MKTVDNDKMTITYEDEKLSCKKFIYLTYADSSDITFIMEDIIDIKSGQYVSMEVKGFFFGEPTMEGLNEYYNKLKAEFTL
jgi:hypothetical protein